MDRGVAGRVLLSLVLGALVTAAGFGSQPSLIGNILLIPFVLVLRALAAVVCPLGVLVCDDVFGHPSFFWSALVLQLLSMAGCVALAGRAISKLLERARKE